jgi:hypothetical protein
VSCHLIFTDIWKKLEGNMRGRREADKHMKGVKERKKGQRNIDRMDTSKESERNMEERRERDKGIKGRKRVWD